MKRDNHMQSITDKERVLDVNRSWGWKQIETYEPKNEVNCNGCRRVDITSLRDPTNESTIECQGGSRPSWLWSY